MPAGASAGRGARLLAFAAGDFAFNLYWQSMMLYLLFYYTEALGLPLTLASLCYALAMGWDGVISLATGLWVDRNGSEQRYRRIIAWGALPLGLCFALAYAPPPLRGPAAFAWILAGHLLLRTAYSLVNIPYLALSARIARDEREQGLIAGWRMLAGTLGALVVSLTTVPLGTLLGARAAAPAFAHAALAFAGVGTLVLWLTLALAPPAQPGAPQQGQPWQALVLAWRGQGFRRLMIATVAMVVAATMIDKSVLYYFKYHLHDQQAGELTLGAMMATGGVAVPASMAVARRAGPRAVWLGGAGLGLASLAMFALGAVQNTFALACFLVIMQAAFVALNFAIWAMLPGVIAEAESREALPMGAVIYGYSAMVQRLGIGLGTLVIGFSLDLAGFARQHASDQSFRLAIVLFPMAMLALAGATMRRPGRVRPGAPPA